MLAFLQHLAFFMMCLVIIQLHKIVFLQAVSSYYTAQSVFNTLQDIDSPPPTPSPRLRNTVTDSLRLLQDHYDDINSAEIIPDDEVAQLLSSHGHSTSRSPSPQPTDFPHDSNHINNDHTTDKLDVSEERRNLHKRRKQYNTANPSSTIEPDEMPMIRLSTSRTKPLPSNVILNQQGKPYLRRSSVRLCDVMSYTDPESSDPLHMHTSTPNPPTQPPLQDQSQPGTTPNTAGNDNAEIFHRDQNGQNAANTRQNAFNNENNDHPSTLNSAPHSVETMQLSNSRSNTNDRTGAVLKPQATEIVTVAMSVRPLLRREMAQFNVAMRPVFRNL